MRASARSLARKCWSLKGTRSKTKQTRKRTKMPQGPKGEKRSKPTDEEMKAKALDRWNNEGGAAATPAKQPKRPRDLNQWAKRMVDIATGEVEDVPTPEDGKDPAAVRRGQLGGA